MKLSRKTFEQKYENGDLRIAFVGMSNIGKSYTAMRLATAFDFKLMNDEKIMGGGQRVLGMDRRGHRLPLYNKADYGYTTHSTQMYYSLPVVMSDRKYAIVFDNTASGYLDIGHSNPERLTLEAIGGRNGRFPGGRRTTGLWSHPSSHTTGG